VIREVQFANPHATVEGYVHRANQNKLRAEWILLGDAPMQLR
jgi:hypothetical protein